MVACTWLQCFSRCLPSALCLLLSFQVFNNIGVALGNQLLTAQRWNASMALPPPLVVWACPSLTTITKEISE